MFGDAPLDEVDEGGVGWVALFGGMPLGGIIPAIVGADPVSIAALGCVRWSVDFLKVPWGFRPRLLPWKTQDIASFALPVAFVFLEAPLYLLPFGARNDHQPAILRSMLPWAPQAA